MQVADLLELVAPLARQLDRSFVAILPRLSALLSSHGCDGHLHTNVSHLELNDRCMSNMFVLHSWVGSVTLIDRSDSDIDEVAFSIIIAVRPENRCYFSMDVALGDGQVLLAIPEMVLSHSLIDHMLVDNGILELNHFFEDVVSSFARGIKLLNNGEWQGHG